MLEPARWEYYEYATFRLFYDLICVFTSTKHQLRWCSQKRGSDLHVPKKMRAANTTDVNVTFETQDGDATKVGVVPV
jgi:hypothetical protein